VALPGADLYVGMRYTEKLQEKWRTRHFMGNYLLGVAPLYQLRDSDEQRTRPAWRLRQLSAGAEPDLD
jgi:hypothetical protein